MSYSFDVKPIGYKTIELNRPVVPRVGDHIFMEESRFEVVQVQHHYEIGRTRIDVICGGDLNAPEDRP